MNGQSKSSSNEGRNAGRQFSFHRSPLDQCTPRQQQSFAQSIRDSLHKMSKQVLIDICLDCFQENQTLRLQHFKARNQLVSSNSEVQELKAAAQKNKEQLRSLVESHSKLATLFQRHMKSCSNQGLHSEEHWERKFRQLDHYMNEYVSQNSEIQEEYLKVFHRLKAQNDRVYLQVATLNRKFKQLQTSSLTRYTPGQSDAKESKHVGQSQLSETQTLREQNLVKQIQQLEEQKEVVEHEVEMLLAEMEEMRNKGLPDEAELKARVSHLEIQNQSLLAQLYFKQQHRQQLNPSQKTLALRHNNVCIPPLKIKTSMSHKELLQRSYQASYF